MPTTATSSTSVVVLMAGSALLVAGLGLGLMAATAASGKGDKSSSRRYRRSDAKKNMNQDERNELEQTTKTTTTMTTRDAQKIVSEDADDEEEYADEDLITEQDVCKFFDRLFLEMQNIFAQLMQQIQQVQQMGQVIPEKQLKALVRGEMERALQIKQRLILEDMDIDSDCLEEATWEFLEAPTENASVKRSVERFQRLWENATGEDVVGWRRGGVDGTGTSSDAVKQVKELLTPEQTIQVADKYFNALTEFMRQIVQSFKAQGKDLKQTTVQQELHMEFAKHASDAGEEALEREGITLGKFEDSVKAHANNAVVGRALAMMQMKQQQDLLSMGSDY